MKKELRAVWPAWLVCLALFATASLMDADISHDVRIGVYFLGAITLGALSIGHEYSGGTLSLLLSQPRRRPDIVLQKLSVLAPILLTLGALGVVLGDGSPNQRALLFVVPLLCGLFVAPWLTMLCRNTLAGIVFTAATAGMLLLVSQTAAAVKFGADPTTATASIAFEAAVLLWGMLAIAAVAAVFGWRLFMRLEAIDGRGHAIQLPWRSAATPDTAAGPLFARHRALWLLAKKELRLQQLSFVVGGLYVLGWFGILAAKSAMPVVYSSLLFALTGLNVLAVSVLAGSLASAEERQLGTLEWHALLPTPARTQWAVKVGITVGVACVLGFAMPMAMASLAGSREIHDSMRPFLSPGAGGAAIVLAVMSLYVSSLCATSLQALLWSVATAVIGFMTFASRWFVAGLVRREANPWFTPFSVLQQWGFWVVEAPAGLIMWFVASSALTIASAAGVLGLLLHFARTNHRSAERSLRRVSRQLLSLVALFGILQILASGVSNGFRVEAEAYSRDLMNRTWGFVTFAAIDSQSRPIARYTVVVFPEEPSRDGTRRPRRIDPSRWPPDAPRDTIFLPGRYSVVAVEPIAQAEALWGPEMIARLKARSVPLTIAAGESQTLQLTLSKY